MKILKGKCGGWFLPFSLVNMTKPQKIQILLPFPPSPWWAQCLNIVSFANNRETWGKSHVGVLSPVAAPNHPAVILLWCLSVCFLKWHRFFLAVFGPSPPLLLEGLAEARWERARLLNQPSLLFRPPGRVGGEPVPLRSNSTNCCSASFCSHNN